MTHITAGPIVIYSNEMNRSHGQMHAEDGQEKPAASKVFKGNEATYLFFPTAASFFLVLLSTLSSPIIKGMSLADIKPQGELGGGIVRFGAWGWCTSDVKNVADGCSHLRPFGGQMSGVLKDLPDELLVLHSLDEMLPKAFNAASDVLTVIACLVAWWSVGTCLAASGAFESRWQQAYKWTTMAYWSTFISFIFTAIELGLDIRKYTLIANAAIGVQSSDPTVSIGPVIWLKMVALIINLGCCLARLLWLKSRPRPTFTMTTLPSHIQSSAALPPQDEMPPSWQTLDIKDAVPIEKVDMPRDSVIVHEVGSPDFTAPPRLPEGRGGAI